QVYHNFVLPHANLRQALAEPISTNGSGSVRLWRPCTPAMAAGFTDHVWSLEEGFFYPVPPWPPAQLAYKTIPPGGSRCVERVGALRCRPAGTSEGLKTDLEGSRSAESDDADGLGEVPEHYPQPTGTRPGTRRQVCVRAPSAESHPEEQGGAY